MTVLRAIDVPLQEPLRPSLQVARSTSTVANVADIADWALHVQSVMVPLPDEPLRVTDWRIQRGEKLAVIGANGVGKTSLSEALLGLRRDAVVEGRMLGVELHKWHRQPRLRKQLGVQLQRVFFPGRPRISELLALHRTLYDRTSQRVIDALGIDALSKRLYEFLSRGETQRVDLFLALAHEPKILFLDEPFTGLDAQFARRLSELLTELRDTTLIMSCHTVEELNLTTHTAWLTRKGIARHDQTQAVLHELVGEFRLTAECVDAASAQRLLDGLRERGALGGALERSPQIDGSHFTLSSSRPLADIARQLVGVPEVISVDVGQSQLGDLLRHCSNGVSA